MKRWHTLVIGLIVSAIALFLSFRQANFVAILHTFQSARYQFVILSALLIMITILIRGFRWSVLTQNRLKWIDAFWMFNIGFLFNNILPARLGELIRAMLVGRRPGLHFTSALSSIVVERLFDMVSVVVLLGIVLLGLDLPGWATTAGAIMGIGALIGIAVLAVSARYPQAALTLGSSLLGRIPRISTIKATDFLRPFVDGLGAVSNLGTFISGLTLSVIAWIASGIAAWVLMSAFWPSQPILKGMMAVAAAGMGIAVPAAPSGVGPFEGAVIGVLVAVGDQPDISRTFAISLHGLNFAITSLFGLIGLLREGAGFRELLQDAEALSHREPNVPVPGEGKPTV
jgi:uncharacterized protein (TIRG00374 family)